MGERREAGFARRIFRTEAGRNHPLFEQRPPVFDAEKVLQKLRDDMLTAMFGTPKKSLEEKR